LKRFLACILLVGHLSGGWALAQAQVGSAPQNLLIITPASNLAENQINLKWDPVPGALGYEVLQKRGSTWWLNEEDPNWTPITSSTSLTGFTADSELEFCVRAVLPGGHSPSSLAVRARTASSTGPAPVSKPAPKVGEESLDLNAPIGDLVPPPPKATRPPKTSTQEAPKGPPPPPPEGLMGFFAGDDRVRLSWRKLAEATVTWSKSSEMVNGLPSRKGSSTAISPPSFWRGIVLRVLMFFGSGPLAQGSVHDQACRQKWNASLLFDYAQSLIEQGVAKVSSLRNHQNCGFFHKESTEPEMNDRQSSHHNWCRRPRSRYFFCGAHAYETENAFTR